MKEKNRLAFPVLADAGNAYARSLELVFSLPHDLRDVYRSLGADLPGFNGDDAWELPLPTRVVVDASGVIRSIDSNADYTKRPEPETTLEVLRSLG